MTDIRNATLLGVIKGHHCYEHPTRGDEAPMIVINPAGRDVSDEFEAWDLETVEDILDA